MGRRLGRWLAGRHDAACESVSSRRHAPGGRAASHAGRTPAVSCGQGRDADARRDQLQSLMLSTFLVLALSLLQSPAQADPAAELAAARQLYANAAYEEALDKLSRAGSSAALADQVDTYRALCLLALGKSRESEQVLER